MAIKEHYRNTYLLYIRGIIGDQDGILFTDDELKGYFDRFSYTSKSSQDLICYDLRYSSSSCGGCGGSPVWQLRVDTGIDGAVYTLDEHSFTAYFDEDDPDNTAPAPSDGDRITVTYYTMRTKALLSELFLVLSSNHAKLVSAQSIAGAKMDLTKLSDAFYTQSVRWAAEGRD